MKDFIVEDEFVEDDCGEHGSKSVESPVTDDDSRVRLAEPVGHEQGGRTESKRPRSVRQRWEASRQCETYNISPGPIPKKADQNIAIGNNIACDDLTEYFPKVLNMAKENF